MPPVAPAKAPPPGRGQANVPAAPAAARPQAPPSPADPGKKPRPRARSGGKGMPSGKSHFPARAGFWGRRDSQGDLVPLTDPALAPLSSQYLVPAGVRGRKRLLQNLLVVAASAILSFLIAWTLLEARRSRRTSNGPAATSAPVAPLTTPVPAPAAPAATPSAAPAPAAAPTRVRPARPPKSRPTRSQRNPRHEGDLLAPSDL
jgi:hypothetical protein